MTYLTATSALNARGATQARSLWGRFSDGFWAFTERCARSEQVRALQSKSDAELAELGLSRDRIAEFVYRDMGFM